MFVMASSADGEEPEMESSFEQLESFKKKVA